MEEENVQTQNSEEEIQAESYDNGGNQKWIIIGALIGVLIVGYLIAANANYWWPFGGEEAVVHDDSVESDSKHDDACVQVITQAKDPENNEVKEFSTPCDVPADWIIINPEEVGYDVIEILGLRSEDVFSEAVAGSVVDEGGKSASASESTATSPRTGMGEWLIFSFAGLTTLAFWHYRFKKFSFGEK